MLYSTKGPPQQMCRCALTPKNTPLPSFARHPLAITNALTQLLTHAVLASKKSMAD